MLRIDRLIGFSSPRGPGLALSLMQGLVLGYAWPSHSKAAKKYKFLNAQEEAGRNLV